MAQTRRLLVPIDFSQASQSAFEWALHLARTQKGTSITLLHVLPEGDDEQLHGAGDETLRGLQKEDIPPELQQWLTRVPKGIKVEAYYVHGEAPHQIASACLDYNIDMVIMASDVDAYETWGEDIATDVIRMSPCPVWVMYTRSAPVPLSRVA